MPKREPIRAEAGSWHHITLFTQDRQPLFSSPALASTMQSVLNAVRERHGLRVVAYCILPNHVQWLFQVTEYSLEAFALAQQRRNSRFTGDPAARFLDRMVSDLRGQSTQALRATEPRLPHELWMTNFWHSQIADPNREPSALALAIASVHATPIRAKLASAPADYAYSSYAHVVYGKPSLVKIDRVPRNVPPEGSTSAS